MNVLKTEFAVCKRIELPGALFISLLGTINLIIVCQYCSKWLLFQLYWFKCNCFIFLHILNCLRIMDVLLNCLENLHCITKNLQLWHVNFVVNI